MFCLCAYLVIRSGRLTPIVREYFRKTNDWEFRIDSIHDNRIQVYGMTPLPLHLQEFQASLRKHRPIRLEDVEALKSRLGDQVFTQLYVPDASNADEGCHLEMGHMIYIAARGLHSLLEQGWTEFETQGVFLQPFARYRTHYAESLGLDVGFPTRPWPIGLICYDTVNPGARQYEPTSDFWLALHSVPVIVAEVDSNSDGRDRIRMLVQGASLVRLVNKLLSELKQTQDFVLMAVYFRKDGAIFIYHLFQQSGPDMNIDNNVYDTVREISNTQTDHATLLHEMYNLCSQLTDGERLQLVSNKWQQIVNSGKSLDTLYTAKYIHWSQ